MGFNFLKTFLYKALLLLIGTSLLYCGKKEEPKNISQQTINTKPENIAVNVVVGIATIEPVNRILPIASEVNGIVDKIYYNVNDSVKKGETIFSLSHVVEQAQLMQAKSKLATQKASIQSLQYTTASLKIKIDNARQILNRNEKMLQGGAITQQTYDDSKTDYESKQKDYETSLSNIKQQQDRLKELEQDINYSEAILNKKYIKAIADGTILNLDIKLGSIVNPNDQIGDFAPKGPYMALTEIDELFANKIKPGQIGWVRLQGAKDTLTTGKIYFVAPSLKKKSLFSDKADNLEDRRVREVRMQLEDKTKVLIGSRVECVIYVKQQ